MQERGKKNTKHFMFLNSEIGDKFYGYAYSIFRN